MTFHAMFISYFQIFKKLNYLISLNIYLNNSPTSILNLYTILEGNFCCQTILCPGTCDIVHSKNNIVIFDF